MSTKTMVPTLPIQETQKPPACGCTKVASGLHMTKSITSNDEGSTTHCSHQGPYIIPSPSLPSPPTLHCLSGLPSLSSFTSPQCQPRAPANLYCLSRPPCFQNFQKKPHKHDSVSYRQNDLQILDEMIRCFTGDIKRIEELQRQAAETRANICNWLAARRLAVSLKRTKSVVELGGDVERENLSKKTRVRSTKADSKRVKLDNTRQQNVLNVSACHHGASSKRLASQRVPQLHSLLGSTAGKSPQQFGYLTVVPSDDFSLCAETTTRRSCISPNSSSSSRCVTSARTATSAPINITRSPLSTLAITNNSSKPIQPPLSKKAHTNSKIEVKAIEIRRRGLGQNTKKSEKSERRVKWS